MYSCRTIIFGLRKKTEDLIMLNLNLEEVLDAFDKLYPWRKNSDPQDWNGSYGFGFISMLPICTGDSVHFLWL